MFKFVASPHNPAKRHLDANVRNREMLDMAQVTHEYLVLKARSGVRDRKAQPILIWMQAHEERS